MAFASIFVTHSFYGLMCFRKDDYEKTKEMSFLRKAKAVKQFDVFVFLISDGLISTV